MRLNKVRVMIAVLNDSFSGRLFNLNLLRIKKLILVSIVPICFVIALCVSIVKREEVDEIINKVIQVISENPILAISLTLISLGLFLYVIVRNVQ